MIQIRQIQVGHDPLQDRLLLRVATPVDEEYRAWLTRRFVRELWPHLAKPLVNPAAPTAPGAAADPGSFNQPFRDDNASYPLGAAPLLVSEVKVDLLADGGLQLTFREGRERSFQISLTPELLQSFCAIMRASAGQADWNLALDYHTADPAATPAATSLSSRLH